MSTPISWTAVQTAIVNWIKTGSGYPTGRVIWRDQNGNRPASGGALDHITVKFVSLVANGMDEIRQIQDLSRASTGPTNVGTEIEYIAEGERILTVSVQCFTSAVVGAAQALAVLSKVQTALSLESVRGALRVVGCMPFDIGGVQDLSALLDAGYEGRAVLTARFSIYEQVSDFSTYIQTCQPIGYMGPPGAGTRDGIDI